MISSGVLERPGWWRSAGIALGLGFAAAPALILIGPLFTVGAGTGFGAGFPDAVGRSLLVAAGAALLSLAVGLPAGLVTSLYQFPLRRPLVGVLALPLLVPSFLWAIGLARLRVEAGLARDGLLSGASGCVIAFAALGIPLVVYATMAAARGITQSQLDGVRLATGESAVLRYTARNVLPAAVLAAVLAGVLSLSDPGPGQILGYSGVATQILVSFSALYDFDLAARQCLALGALVLVVVAPLAWWSADRLSAQLFGRDVRGAKLYRTLPARIVGPFLLAGIVVLTTVLPLAGHAWPATRRLMLSRAFAEVTRTAGNTLLYAVLAAAIAVLCGVILAICAGRDQRRQRLLLTALLVLLALPPALGALGVVQAASLAPQELDFLFRGRFTVGAVLALRFLPVATILLLRSTSSSSPSWAAAAAVHGVGLARYLRRVLVPLLTPVATVAALLVALLATAEVGTVLLVQPPGEPSLPVAIFTVMANAPESLVATLCLIYIGGAAIILSLAMAALSVENG